MKEDKESLIDLGISVQPSCPVQQHVVNVEVSHYLARAAHAYIYFFKGKAKIESEQQQITLVWPNNRNSTLFLHR